MRRSPEDPRALLQRMRSAIGCPIATTQGRGAAKVAQKEAMAESTKELTAEGATVTTTAEGNSATAAPPAEPKKLLVALTTGPATDPSKCALAFLVAAKAAAAGHSVSMFLASDGVQCLTDDVIGSLEGVGTGKLSETYPACVAAGVTFYVSGMSCKARNITPESLATKNAGGGPVTFEMPPKLLELTFAADSTLSF